MQHDQRTKDYVARRSQEGKSNKEIMRCLKRAIAREAYRALTSQAPMQTTDLRQQPHSKNLTRSQAATALNTDPARISEIERQQRPLPDLTARYKKWLDTA